MFDLERLLPSMPFHGDLLHPPLPEGQKCFVNPDIDSDIALPLLLFSPHHGASGTTIQCGLVETLIHSPHPFCLVANTTINQIASHGYAIAGGISWEVPKLHRFKAPHPDHDNRCLIILNDMSFKIPKILELFPTRFASRG